MPNENPTVDNQSQTAVEPVDIAQAFKMYNQSQRESSQEQVAHPEDNSVDGENNAPAEPEGTGEGTPGADELVPATSGETDLGGANDSVGGSSSVIEPVDYSPAKQEILKNIQDNAIAQVRKEMKDNGIELWTTNDIYERDEETGRVTWRNPDDPNNPFSNRTEAQAWVNSINQDIENHFRTEVNKKQQQLVQEAAPMLRTIDFAPVYNSMSEIEQKVFDDLVAPYAVADSAGRVIGFNTDLNAAANVAKSIAKRFQTQAPQPQAQTQQAEPQAKNQSSPALDMPTGNGAAELDEEPKTLGEALKMFDSKNAKKKGK